MKDRFTSLLLLLVAFGGGLLAMVVIARWQQGESKAPEATPRTTAQAVPGSRTETEDDTGLGQAAPGATPLRPLERFEASRATTTPIDAPGTPPRADPDPIAAGGSTSSPRPDDSKPTGADTRAHGERPTVDPESNSSREGRSNPAAGPIGRSSQKPGRSGQSSSTRDITGAPRAVFLNPAQGDVRPAPRSEATETLPEPSEPQPSTGDSADAEQDPPFEDAPDSQPDPPRQDDPREEQEQEQEPEQEPQAPVAKVRMNPVRPLFAVGDAVPVTVEISSGTDVGHVPFYVDFDPRVLRFDRGEEGPFLGLDGVSTMFVAAQSGAGDSVVVGLSRLGQSPGIDGDGRLCVLYFVAIAPGTSNLRFDRAKVKDSTNRTVRAEFEPAAVTVR